MRSKEQWLKLIEEQSLSGQTATAFCNERGINPKYFSIRKCKLKNGADKAASQSSFVRCTTPSPKAVSTGIKVSSGAVSINLPVNCSAQWLAQLVRELR